MVSEVGDKFVGAVSVWALQLIVSIVQLLFLFLVQVIARVTIFDMTYNVSSRR